MAEKKKLLPYQIAVLALSFASIISGIVSFLKINMSTPELFKNLYVPFLFSIVLILYIFVFISRSDHALILDIIFGATALLSLFNLFNNINCITKNIYYTNKYEAVIYEEWIFFEGDIKLLISLMLM